MKRKRARFDVGQTALELLANLQMTGRLEDASPPLGAHRENHKELLDALRLLSDGAWIRSAYAPSMSPSQDAQRWLSQYLAGKEVLTPDDILNSDPYFDATPAEGDDAEGEPPSDPDASAALEQYAETLAPKRAKAFRAMLADSAFKLDASELLNAYGSAAAAACFVSDEEFSAERKSFMFLEPARLRRPELAAMMRHHVIDALADHMAELKEQHPDLDVERAHKRLKALAPKLDKAIEKAASGEAPKEPTRRP